MQDTTMGCGNNLPTLLENLISDRKCVFEISIYMVSNSAFSKSPKAAKHTIVHRDGSMFPASFSKTYDTRVKLRPSIFQKFIFPGKPMTPHDHVLYLYIFRMHNIHTDVWQESCSS